MPAELPHLSITGGTGFVGRNVIRAALDNGHQVRALIRNPENAPFHHDNLEWFPGALGDKDAEFVARTDCLIHIAGLIKARRKQDYYAVNAEAAASLANAAENAGVGRLILLSSMAAAQPHLSDYAGSKRAGEDAVKAVYSGNLAVIRAPAVFGPGDIATAPFYKAMARGILPVPGGRGWRERKLSMAYVDDLARDLSTQAVTGVYDGKTVSPATAQIVRWPEFAEICSRVAGRKVKAVPLPLPVLYSVAGVTSVTSRVFGMGHLTLGKLGEFLYQDWSSSDIVANPTPLEKALKETLSFYKVI